MRKYVRIDGQKKVPGGAAAAPTSTWWVQARVQAWEAAAKKAAVKARVLAHFRFIAEGCL